MKTLDCYLLKERQSDTENAILEYYMFHLRWHIPSRHYMSNEYCLTKIKWTSLDEGEEKVCYYSSWMEIYGWAKFSFFIIWNQWVILKLEKSRTCGTKMTLRYYVKCLTKDWKKSSK